MDGIWGERSYSSYSFLISALEGGEWSASHQRRCTPGDTSHGKHCTVAWVDPRAGLDAEVRGKTSSAFVGNRISVVQSVIRHYTDGAHLRLYRYHQYFNACALAEIIDNLAG
jgi:hypothetical protein